MTPGGQIKGVVDILGGNTAQQIDDIYLILKTKYVKESDDKKYHVTGVIDQFRLVGSLILGKNERKTIPFSFQLPLDTPISMGRTQVWIETGLDIKNSVDPTDKDYVRVVPNEMMESVFLAVNNLGFRLREAECEQAPYRIRGRLPFIQEFEFVASSGPFRGRLDELEITFFPKSTEEMEILMQVDRRVRGLGSLFSEALNLDESNIRFTVRSSELSMIQQKIQSIIQSHL